MCKRFFCFSYSLRDTAPDEKIKQKVEDIHTHTADILGARDETLSRSQNDKAEVYVIVDVRHR